MPSKTENIGYMRDFYLLQYSFPTQPEQLPLQQEPFLRFLWIFRTAHIALENNPDKDYTSNKHLKTPRIYKVVVIRVPLQGQNATIDKVLWIGLNLLPQDGFQKGSNHGSLFFSVNQLDTARRFI